MPLRDLSRREFLGAAAAAAIALPAWARGVPPEAVRTTLSFNLDWKFIREDVSGAEDPAFDDSRWATVSTPHTFNDIDSFRKLISHSGGDVGTYKGLAWYRKRFRIPQEYAGRKLFLEFEGMRQAGDIFLNGKEAGLYENGITAYGLDITDAVHYGAQENVLAVKIDNSTLYAERATSTPFEWNANDFNPDFGGINRPVWLHVLGRVYQTLPLYYGLQSSGVYAYGTDFDIAGRSASVAVESEVRNESDRDAVVELSALIVGADGKVCADLRGPQSMLAAGARAILKAAGPLRSARFWSPADPHLYTVYSTLRVDGKTADICPVVTGFRKTAFRGGAGTGGVFINDEFVYLKGFAQRASNEWAGLGQAYPDWMHDYNARMMRATHANYVRWMHVSPQRIDADAMARYGLVQICPAGDKERDAAGRQWEQRVEVMRASMIYFRNNPSILFWEAGNTVITVDQMKEMIALRNQWDPHGGRLAGYRDNDNYQANTALTPVSEYYEVMIGQAPQTDALHGPDAMFRGYSEARRDRAPLIEAEDFRDECARRYWDEFSPPFYGFKKGPHDTYQYTSESFALAGIRRFYEYQKNCISNPDPAHSKWSGYASIYFSDSDADGRQDSSEVARVSGKVDAVRLPKQLYFAHRVLQNPRPDLHILGHWSYPTDREVVKTIYVVSNAQSVELFVNDRSLGTNNQPESGYIFAFPAVRFVPGSLRAVGRNHERIVAEHRLTTAGAPAAVRLTPIVGPGGLQADGCDIALIDVEVVDAHGERCPTDDARIDFTCTGPALWRGGYNSGIVDSTNNLYLNTELGINRVAVRSTLTAGTIVVTAARKGLPTAEARIESHPVELQHGLAQQRARRLPATWSESSQHLLIS